MSFLQKLFGRGQRSPAHTLTKQGTDLGLAPTRKRYEPNKTKRRLARGMVLLPNGRMTSRHDLRCLAVMGMRFTTKKAKTS